MVRFVCQAGVGGGKSVHQNRTAACARTDIVPPRRAYWQVVWKCEYCNKTFRSEKSYEQHTRSKKHKKRVTQLGGRNVGRPQPSGKSQGAPPPPPQQKQPRHGGGKIDQDLLDEMLELDIAADEAAQRD